MPIFVAVMRMKISYNWLRDYLPMSLSPEKTGDLLTSVGLEVESMERTGPDERCLQSLITGLIVSAEKHPDADRLKVTKVDIGRKDLLTIVCGAPNVAVGRKVIVATPGVTLHPMKGDPFTIKISKIRGQASEGMLCAADEIGLSEDHSGLLLLPPDTAVGRPVAEVLNTDTDYIFEIGLTPNRSDAFCHLGVAADLAAVMNARLGMNVQFATPSELPTFLPTGEQPIKVSVSAKDACIRYSAIVLSDIKINESPKWMQDKLKNVGFKPINNVVDITNYVMLESGQPLHAFDLASLTGQQVNVGFVADGTTFKTLDGQNRLLHPEDLMISNAEGPMCIAGVYGGAESGVKDSTTAIFLESACFDPLAIRRTAQRHQLRTDSAQRFEKGVDPNGCRKALLRAVSLFTELCQATVSSDITDIYPLRREPARIKLRWARLQSLAGQHIAPEKTKTILAALNIHIINEDSEGILLEIPTNKTDVTREIDVIEEILRIYGLDNIALPLRLKSTVSFAGNREETLLQEKISETLVARGYAEMMNTSLTQSRYYDPEQTDSRLLKLLSNANAQLDVLRTNLLFGGLEVVRHNRNRQQYDLRLFEWGYTYEGNTAKPSEKSELLLLSCGTERLMSWQPKRSTDFFDLKINAEKILRLAGFGKLKGAYASHPFYEYALCYRFAEKEGAWIGRVKGEILQRFDIDVPVFAAVIDPACLYHQWEKTEIKFTPVSKFPTVHRDLALLLSNSVRFDDVEAAILSVGNSLVKDIQLFDIYTDKKIGEDHKSYAVNIAILHDEKTLTDVEIDKLMSCIQESIVQKTGAEIRGK